MHFHSTLTPSLLLLKVLSVISILSIVWGLMGIRSLFTSGTDTAVKRVSPSALAGW